MTSQIPVIHLWTTYGTPRCHSTVVKKMAALEVVTQFIDLKGHGNNGGGAVWLVAT